MQFQVCESDDSCQPGAQYTNPRVVVQEHHGAPLLNCSGLVLVRQLIERLGVARAIDAGVRVLQRCKWYRESDHILTLIYSMISGGSRLQDVNRLGQSELKWDEVRQEARCTKTSYVLGIEHADQFFQRIWVEMNRRSADLTKLRLVFIGDGAEWIWNRVAEIDNADNGVYILDFLRWPRSVGR